MLPLGGPTTGRPSAVSLKGAGLIFVATPAGEVRAASRRGDGLYAWDTRHLSSYALRVDGERPRVVRAEVLPDGARLEYALRNGRSDIRISRRLRIGNTLHDRWAIRNEGTRAVSLRASLEVAADFRDLLEVRRPRRVTRGRLDEAARTARGIRLAYTAVDGVRHATDVEAAPRRWTTGHAAARGEWSLRVDPDERRTLDVRVRVRSTGQPRLAGDGRRWHEWRETATRFASDSPDLDRWLAQSSLDLFVLSERVPEGLFPLAGIPWFATVFGRDSLITAMSALTLHPQLALGVLRHLAGVQGRVDDATRDEEPGRIPHEIRNGELVRTGAAFRSPYYGSVDATPLFVWLASEAARWSGAGEIVTELGPALRAAVRWMDEWGDRDGDGLIEYGRRARHGIDNQVWKDSHDSLLTPDGAQPRGPIAAVEVQAYAYAARRGLAEVVAQRDAAWARSLASAACAARERFERAFWMEDRAAYAQALDGAKRAIRDVTSNVGHVLWAGIASDRHGRRAALRLRAPDMASGWGIRTRSSRSPFYDPASYHNGSVWPHDTAIAAAGMARYGARRAAARTIADLIEAARTFPQHRLPELFGGERRDGAVAPVSYPVACSPQAWTAAAAFLCVRTMLGIDVDPRGRRVRLDPLLPDGVARFEARGLRVGGGSLDVRVERAGRGVAEVTLLDARGVDVTT